MTRADHLLGPGRKRIAVVGAGVAGLLAAERLAVAHDVTVFEAENRIGGHTHTVLVPDGERQLPVDTGFIVCNDRTYPGFLRLLRRLGVALRPSTMSFSVRSDGDGVEFNGSSLGQLFAQRRNLLRPAFWSMLRGIRRFHRTALDHLDSDLTLGELLAHGGYGEPFARWYLVPMMAAIWSAEATALLRMPARFFVRFFHNHGMLRVKGRPQWLSVVGGSRSYLGPLSRPFADRIVRAAPVAAVRRLPAGDGVGVRVGGGGEQRFDAAVVATHSDQALRLLVDASPAEREVLGAIPYQANDVVLHTDDRLMPRRRRAWAAWNYHATGGAETRATLTYCMNILQGLDTDVPWLVTLNATDRIDPARIVRRFVYEHPVFDGAGVAAQARVPAVSGRGRVWFCGAWCGFGFHEDAVQSALRVAADFGIGETDLAAPALVAGHAGGA